MEGFWVALIFIFILYLTSVLHGMSIQRCSLKPGGVALEGFRGADTGRWRLAESAASRKSVDVVNVLGDHRERESVRIVLVPALLSANGIVSQLNHP